PVTEPQHAPEGDDHQHVPPQPAGREEEPPYRAGGRWGGALDRDSVFHATRVALEAECPGIGPCDLVNRVALASRAWIIPPWDSPRPSPARPVGCLTGSKTCTAPGRG